MEQYIKGGYYTLRSPIAENYWVFQFDYIGSVGWGNSKGVFIQKGCYVENDRVDEILDDFICYEYDLVDIIEATDYEIRLLNGTALEQMEFEL